MKCIPTAPRTVLSAKPARLKSFAICSLSHSGSAQDKGQKPNGVRPRKGLLLLTLLLLLTTRWLVQAASVVTINEDKVLVVNGRKVFPITLSPGPPTRSVTPTGKDALQELREAGALMVRMTQTTDWNDQVRTDQQAVLDWAAQREMFVMVNLRELSAFVAGNTARETELRTVVNLFKNHSALGVWKNKDEAWWGGIPVTDLQRGYDVIKQEDPNHPVEQTHAPRGTLPELQPYNSAADIIAFDVYPIGYPPGTHSGTNLVLTNKEISMIGDWTDFLAQIANGQKQYWMIEQIAWSGVTPPSKTLRFPNFFESRFMAYQAIIRGARGLMFFGGNVAATLNPQDAPLGWNWTFWDQVLKRVVQQLGDNSLLADALVAPASTLPVQVTSAATNIEFCVREAPPYLYVLACKREGITTNATFSGLPNWAGTGEVLYESPRVVNAQGGQFTDWFAPFDVHVYRFYQPPQPTNQFALYEPFDYPNIGGPVTSNTPSNWAYGGSNPNDLSVLEGNLTYAGLAASVGNSVTNGGAGLGVRRLLGQSFSSGELYFSGLLRINDLGYGVWNGNVTPLGAFIASDNSTFRLSVVIQSNSPSGYIVGVRKSTSDPSVFDGTEHYAGETLLLVGKYDFNTSPDTVSLWINPNPVTLGAAMAPATGFVTATSGADGYVIDRFNMRQNTAASVPAAMQWDELRFGTSWAAVTPAAAPSSTVLASPEVLSDGKFRFSFGSGTGLSSRVYASTNLLNWTPIGSATQVVPGQYRFIDAAASDYPLRFYQLRWP